MGTQNTYDMEEKQMNCSRCGFDMGNNNVCPGCGMVHNTTPATPVTSTSSNIPAEYQPISAWGYFGWNLLFGVPCVGFIVLLVFALGGTKNINLKNYARSFFCIMLLTVIILVILAVTGVLGTVLGGAALENSGYYY